MEGFNVERLSQLDQIQAGDFDFAVINKSC